MNDLDSWLTSDRNEFYNSKAGRAMFGDEE